MSRLAKPRDRDGKRARKRSRRAVTRPKPGIGKVLRQIFQNRQGLPDPYIAVDQHRFRICPHAWPAAKLLAQTLGPDDLAAVFFQASQIAVGAQDMFWEKEGAYTGAVSAHMLLAA